MPNPNAIVSKTIRLEPRLDRPATELLRAEGGLSIELDGGRRVRLNPADRRSPALAQVLDGLSKQKLPVYLEIDPATSFIQLLLIPDVTRVIAIRPAQGGDLSIELDRSHGRHLLRANAPDFAELERQLRNALEKRLPLVITETDAHDIIDIRDYLPDPGAPPLPPFPEPRPPLPRPPWLWWWLYRLWCWPWWPWWWFRWLFRCISPAYAQQVFDAMSATTCNPTTVPPPCIPFLFPDDGCWARAHEMCRLMINMGLSPRKVWIQGSLHTLTKNNPNCFVNWGWHVAPTLCVRGSGTMVIDPSLFTTPVSEATWKSVQGDPNATLTETEASDYFWGSTDPAYTDTNFQLAKYRLKLQTRALQQGPPPYANCP